MNSPKTGATGNRMAVALLGVLAATLPVADAVTIHTDGLFANDHPVDQSGWYVISKDARLGVSGNSLLLKGKSEAKIHLADDETANVIHGACVGREGTSFAVLLKPITPVASSEDIIAVKGPERQYIIRKPLAGNLIIISELLGVSRSGRYVMAVIGISNEVDHHGIRYTPTLLDAETGAIISRNGINDWVEYRTK